MKKLYLIIILFVSVTGPVLAQPKDYFIRPVFGLSLLSGTSGQSQGLGQLDGNISVDVDNGINAGIGLGYFYRNNFAVELFWEYRSNDSQTTLMDNTLYDDGNYASSLFFVNGHYFIDIKTNLRLYTGVGLGWAQEIDIDLEQNGSELSYSGSGNLAFQGFVGFDYALSKSVSINVEARYIQLNSPKLLGENTSGMIEDLDYKPSTLQIGLAWRF